MDDIQPDIQVAAYGFRPEIYITMADNGEEGNTTLKVGNIEISAAPPPMATITAAKSRATNTTPNTNSSGLQKLGDALVMVVGLFLKIFLYYLP